MTPNYALHLDLRTADGKEAQLTDEEFVEEVRSLGGLIAFHRDSDVLLELQCSIPAIETQLRKLCSPLPANIKFLPAKSIARF